MSSQSYLLARISKDINDLREDVKYFKRKMAQLNLEVKRLDNNVLRHEEALNLKLTVAKYQPKTDYEEKPES